MPMPTGTIDENVLDELAQIQTAGMATLRSVRSACSLRRRRPSSGASKRALQTAI